MTDRCNMDNHPISAGAQHYNLKRLNKCDYTFTRSKFMSVASVNACSIRNKYLDFIDHVRSNNFDVCLVCETWLSPSDGHITAALKNNTYDFISVPRSSRQGGGLGILHKRDYNVSLLCNYEFNSFECAEFKISMISDYFICIYIYRPPYSQSHPVTVSSFLSEFEEYLEKTLTEHKDPIIMGDFNIHINKLDDPNTKTFNHILSACGLQQHVQSPTHNSGNTLDLLITTITSRYQIQKPHVGYFLSDHAFISTDLSIVKSHVIRKTLTYRNYKSIDERKFTDDLVNVCKSLISLDSGLDPAAAYNSTLSKLLDKHAPLVTMRRSVRDIAPWYDNTAQTIKTERRRLERRWRRTKSSQDYHNFQESKKAFRNYISSRKSEYINNKIQECGKDSKKLYHEVSVLLDTKQNSKFPPGKSDEVLAEQFAAFFVEKIDKIRKDLAIHPSYEANNHVACEFTNFHQVSVDYVVKLLSSASSASCQSDPLPTFLVKKYSQVLAPVIAQIINMSFKHGHFYQDWKIALVKPLLKKINLKLIIDNYRPVSNLPFISKISEKAALNQFIPYCNLNKLIPDYQSAYRQFYSTETALLRIVNDFLCSMESQMVTAFIAIDLSAAFDTVDHCILSNVLQKNFGVKGNALEWFQSYLSSRTFKVCVNDSQSTACNISCSVPQGSCAGPVLYTVYASTLGDVIQDESTYIIGYADDHGIYSAFSPKHPAGEEHNTEKLQETIDNIRNWMNKNKLKMNDSKTEFIYVGGRQQLSKCKADKIMINHHIIQRSQAIKYLGVILDEKLSFGHHITSKCQIAAINIYRIKAIRKYLTRESCSALIQSLVLSHLDYCSSLFYGISCVNIRKMQRIQNWGAKLVLQRGRYDSSSRALYELNWLPVQQKIEFRILTLVYKCLTNQAPQYLIDLIRVRQFTRSTRLSSRDDIILVVPNTKRSTFASRSFSVTGPRLWNSLPLCIKQSNTLNQFQRLLKRHLFETTFAHFM